MREQSWKSVLTAIALSVVLSIPIVMGPSSSGETLPGGGDSVGPTADTAAPHFLSFERTTQKTGPKTPVDVGTRLTDESNTTVEVFYGFDNSTWSNLSASRTGSPTKVYTDRNPASGYARGVTLTRTYNPGVEITYLNVYCYSSDSDTLYVNVEGYNSSSGSWATIFYQNSYSPGTGTKVNQDLKGRSYTQWRISYRDTENNDNIYYNCTYKAGEFTFNATIPAPGNNPKVYYYFNATDEVGNNATSRVFNYTVDLVKPMIRDFTKPSSLRRDGGAIPIYSNVSDGTGVDRVYLNWSTDGYTTFDNLAMTRVAGTSTSGQWMAPLPAPAKNTTVYIRVGAEDVVGNHNNTTAHGFTWNPPPRIDNLTHTPQHPNSLDAVNVSCDVTDLDGVDTVRIRYSTDQSTWKDATVNSSGSHHSAVLAADLGSPWLYYRVWANDTEGGTNQTPVARYYVDKTKPRIHTPYIQPTYPNASVSVYVLANITDFVGIEKARVLYSTDGGSTWGSVAMSKPSDVASLEVAGYCRVSNSGYYDGLEDVGSLLGTWNSSISGHGGTPPAALFTDADVILLDGAGTSWYASEAIAAARAGRLVVVTYSTWSAILSTLSGQTYSTHVTSGFTTYGFNLGRGAIVMSYSITNRNYMGFSYDGYSDAIQANLAGHLAGAHEAFTPFGGLVPPTSTSKRVLFRINATDLSNLTTESTNYEYSTDGNSPTFNGARPSPVPAGWDRSQAFTVWANVSDDVYLEGVTLRYSVDAGATWTSTVMTRSSGNATTANYTATIPSTGVSTWVYYHYDVADRAHNHARSPATSNYAYQTSDPPTITGITHDPSVGNRTTPVTVTATVRDPDVVGVVTVYYRYGTGSWTPVSASAGTNDLWSAQVPSPGVSTTVYFYITARDSIGVWSTSSTYSYQVDGVDPYVRVVSRSPEYPSSSTAVTVQGIAKDESGTITASLEYRYGPTGTVSSVSPTFTERSYSDRNPTTGYTYGTLQKAYPTAGTLTYLNVYCYSYDSDTLNIRIRAYRNSTSTWVTLYSSGSTGTGTKVNANLRGLGYGAWDIRMWDTEGNDATYYRASWRVDLGECRATVPAPGYSTWVYYRLRGTDAASNENVTQWYSYWADGSAPRLTSHTGPSSPSAETPVPINATFADEHAIDRAVLFFSFGGGYQSVAMTAIGTPTNTTLAASGNATASLLPLTVYYYFGVYDKAGNYGQTGIYTYATTLGPVDEGTAKTYDATNVYSAIGYKAWSWDFDYDGSFNQDASGRSVSHTFMDDGSYTIALRLTDNNDVVTILTFDQTVNDLGPTARIGYVGNPVEGSTFTLDGTPSTSSPDAIVSYEWDLSYDGSTFDVDSTGPRPSHVVMDNGTITVGLKVTDDDGSTSTTQVVVTIRDLSPDIDLSVPTFVDEGAIVDFDASATTSYPDALGRFEWDFDYDGTFVVDATGNITTHTYKDDGNYRFRLRVYDEDGSYSEEQGRITVRDLAPKAIINRTFHVVEGRRIDVDGGNSTSYPDAIVSYEWDFHFDGAFNAESVGVSANFTYMDDGNYTIALRVTDDDGSRNVNTTFANVTDGAPNARFHMPQFVDEGQTFEVNATRSESYPDAIASYEWDFDYDGETFDVDGMGVVLEHDYMDNGTYIVALRVKDDDGSAVVRSNTILVNDLGPTAGLSQRGPLLEGEELTLDATSSTSWPDIIRSYEWDLSYDGSTFDVNAEGVEVRHIYMDDGLYVVALRVTDDDGSSVIVTTDLEIADRAPVARLFPVGGGPDPMEEGQEASLNATVHSRSYPDAIVGYEWWWEADGELSVGPGNATLHFVPLSPGEHTIWMRVTDDDGSVDVTNVTFMVSNRPPVAIFVTEPVPEGEPMVLNASSSREPGWDMVAFRWDLDDDGVWDVDGPEPVVEHTWTVPGFYTVLLEVEDEDGSKDRINGIVTVTDVVPVADAGGPYEVAEGVRLNLSAGASHEPGGHLTRFSWDMDGDGVVDVDGIEAVATWSWDVAGLYWVTLTVEDAEGNAVKAYTNVTVLDRPPSLEMVLPDDPMEGQAVGFTVTGLRDPGTLEFEVTWHFGDGSSDVGQEVEHAYSDQGEYTGRLEVRDNDGGLHVYPFERAIVVTNEDPVLRFTLPVGSILEDDPFALQLTAEDTANDTLTFEFDGPGGEIDPVTGWFTWTPLDEHVGTNTFTFRVRDEDGGVTERVAVISVEDVDNDFLGGMSTAGGSAIILLILLIIVVAVAVLYMRHRGSGPLGGAVDEGPEEEEVEPPTVDPVPEGPGGIRPEAPMPPPPQSPETPPPPPSPPTPLPPPPPPPPPTGLEGVEELPDGAYVHSGSAAASGEAASPDTSQVPPPPPTPPVSGAEFNQLLEDRASESELDADEETEMEGDSEWEMIE